MEWRKVILLLVMVFGAAGKVRADMVQAFGVEDQSAIRPLVSDCAAQQAYLASDMFSSYAAGDMGSACVGLLAPAPVNAADFAGSQPARVLSDRQDSLGLCLYALLGLGLCKSAPWVKRLSLGVIPGWYHDGGPFQIGHSLAISPDCLSTAAVYPFVQSDSSTLDLVRQCRRVVVVVSVRWRSQFSTSVLASRGPPHSITGLPMT